MVAFFYADKMKKIFTISILVAGLGHAMLFAQTEKHCGQHEANERFYNSHPGARERTLQIKESLAKKTKSNRTQSQPYIIPIVFHVVHNYGTENISDAQIHDAVRILNEDFQARNADTSLIVNDFKNLKADCQMEFRLAKIDPNGNCTNGIVRRASALTNSGEDNVKTDQWDPTKYLNVWVVANISFGAAGYAYYPSTADSWPEIDGVVILSTYVGSIGTGTPYTSRALTHEVGHWMELSHVWGDTNDPGVSCGDDWVSDTPETKGWTGCNLNGSVCNQGVIENVQNYMEYSYCERMFTLGQRDRMQDVLNSTVAGRNNIASSTNLIATGTDDAYFFSAAACAPVADFKANVNLTCAGNNITFTDMSYNGTPASWNWSFPGGSPSVSGAQNPVVNYATPGTYPVTLKVSNAAGTDSIIKNSFICINSSSAQYSTAYSESFETSALPNSDWFIYGNDAYSWEQSVPGKTGSFSMHLNNTNADDGMVDYAVSPSVNVSTIPSAVLTFKLAYAVKTLQDSDRLRVLTSTNCGQTWTQRYSKKGPPLATAPEQFTDFVPDATQWRTETVNINNTLSAQNVKFKFEFTGGAGNDIYIDDINILGTVGINNTLEDIKPEITPNPSKGASVLTFNHNGGDIEIKMVDVLGREVQTVYKGYLSYGIQKFDLNKKEIGEAGIYFVMIKSNGNTVSKKLVVE